MALALSLPPLEARPANPPETRPARVQPWLEETLKRDPVDAAGVIGDALAACRATPRRFDAAVVGHLLSAASALDLAAALRAIVPNMPILLATASVDESGAEALVAAGISEIVHRPLISAELASALARCLTISEVSVENYGRNAFPGTEITL